MARIELRNVSVEFPVYNLSARSFKKNFIRLATGGNISKDANDHVVVQSLSEASCVLEHGDRIGLIGHNGAGKTTLLRLLAGIYEPTTGSINIHGKISPLLNLMHGIESECTGYENIYIRGALLGMTRAEIRQQVNSIAEWTELGGYLSMPVRTYSQGMMVRLAFGISTSLVPDILLIDEVFGAGDASFMTKARERMTSLVYQSNIVAIATHSDELIHEFCNKALLLEGGKIKYFGDVKTAFAIYHQQG